MEWNTEILERLQHYKVRMLTGSILSELRLVVLLLVRKIGTGFGQMDDVKRTKCM